MLDDDKRTAPLTQALATIPLAPPPVAYSRGAYGGNAPSLRDPYYAEVVALREQLADALEQLRYVKDLVSPPGLIFPQRWRLTDKEARLLRALMAAVTITKERLLVAMYDTEPEVEIKIVDVFVCKLRKKLLNPDKIVIGTMWGAGYTIAVDMKAKIMAAIEADAGTPQPQRMIEINPIGRVVYSGAELRAQRYDLNLSQFTVARMIGAPHPGYLSSIENGGGSPTWHRLYEKALRAERRRRMLPDPAPSGA